MPRTELRYEKLADELAGLIADSVLRAGDRLPSVRRLAEECRLSATTVVQSLRELERRGLIEARPQSGFYVRPPRAALPEPQSRKPPRSATVVDVSQRILRVLQAGTQPGVAPLAAALPSPELLPIAALNRLYSSVARRYPKLLNGDGHVHMNEPALVRQLVKQSMARSCPLTAEEIVITNSCTEALGLCLRAVTQPGDTVAVESPAYYLMLQLLEVLGLKALEIPCDPSHGLSIEALDLASRQRRIAACLIVANASNPLGSLMPDENKRRLVRLAAERNIAIIEDDIYGDLHFAGHRPWPIKSFDETGNVMLCASFSKSLSPSLRIGYIAAGRRHAELALQKTLTSGGTNPITQIVLAEHLASGAHERHLRQQRRHYEMQVAAMREAGARHFPAETRTSRPQGGFVLWVELPDDIDTTELHARAIAEGIAFVPGELFSASGMYRNCLRLNCGNPMTPEIEDAVKRLGKLIRPAGRQQRQ